MSAEINDTASFRESYDVLADIAKKLRNQEKPDIDGLVPMVEQATAAYKICKQRLDNVSLALKEHFAGETEELT